VAPTRNQWPNCFILERGNGQNFVMNEEYYPKLLPYMLKNLLQLKEETIRLAAFEATFETVVWPDH
jgi:hypothetical protein